MQNGELEVLNVLKWNLCSITPFDFLDYMLTGLSIGNHYNKIRGCAKEIVKSCFISGYMNSLYTHGIGFLKGVQVFFHILTSAVR